MSACVRSAIVQVRVQWDGARHWNGRLCIELRARQAGRNVGQAEVRVPESVHGRGWAVREHQEI